MRFEFKRHSKKNKPRTAADLHKKKLPNSEFWTNEANNQRQQKNMLESSDSRNFIGGQDHKYHKHLQGFHGSCSFLPWKKDRFHVSGSHVMIVMIIFVPSFDEFVSRFFCISFMCFMISGISCDLLELFQHQGLEFLTIHPCKSSQN